MKRNMWLMLMFCVAIFTGCKVSGGEYFDSNVGSVNSVQSQYVYFVPNDVVSGENIYVYTWDFDGNSNSSWPGVPMTYDGNGIYSAKVNHSNLIFTTSDGSWQTVDLYLQSGYFIAQSINTEGKVECVFSQSYPTTGGSESTDNELRAPSYVYASYEETYSGSRVACSWEYVPAAVSYNIYYGKLTDPNYAKLMYNTAETSFELDVETTLSDFYFFVSSVGKYGEESAKTRSNLCIGSDDNDDSTGGGGGVVKPPYENPTLLIKPDFATDLRRDYRVDVQIINSGNGISFAVDVDTRDPDAEYFELHRSTSKYGVYQMVSRIPGTAAATARLEDSSIGSYNQNYDYYYKIVAVNGNETLDSSRVCKVEVGDKVTLSFVRGSDLRYNAHATSYVSAFPSDGGNGITYTINFVGNRSNKASPVSDVITSGMWNIYHGKTDQGRIVAMNKKLYPIFTYSINLHSNTIVCNMNMKKFTLEDL